MSSFAPSAATQRAKTLDPAKRVNYTLGMVLGVDDLTQESAYLIGRDRSLARDLLGYGTVCGLQVTVEEGGDKGPRVVVEAGVALSPQGQLIRVAQAQCAYLNDWLRANRQVVRDHLASPPEASVTLYAALCYRECPTDAVPIPGEPCRSEDEATAPSRLADDFKLELRLTPPEQREEDGLRDFVAWFNGIEMTGSLPSTPLDEFIQAIRDSAHLLGSPPGSPPDFMHGSPPASLHINAADACAYLRTAFRVWVTELRPHWLGRGQSCGTPPDEECLLLAELQVPLVQELLNNDWKVSALDALTVNEDRRPYLIHLRLLQEWLACGQRLIGPGMSGPEVGSLSAFETDLTRIVALSWPHGRNTLLDLAVDGAPQKGVIVAFGKGALGDGGLVRVESGSLDDETFQVFVELSETESGVDFWTHRRIRPDAILPVVAQADLDGFVTQASQVTGPQAPAAALLLSEAAFRFLEGKKLIVVLKGDYVLDETGGRAIDADFARTELPTGDRPRRATIGVQGGRFESWVRVGRVVNVNTATEAELRTLPRIGPALAARIVTTRTARGGFRTIDDLLGVPGIGAELLNHIRPFITLGP